MSASRRRDHSHRWVALGAALLVSAAWQPAGAADFFLYLKCEGRVAADKNSKPGHLDLALRDNNMTALIQRSDTLPVGERLRYQVSPVAYSMTYRVPGTGSTVLYDWWRGQMFVWQPSLKRVAHIRLSIDRQSGRLSGEMLNAQDQTLATLGMSCKAIEEDDLPAPKF